MKRNSVAFVRQEMIAPSAPPVQTTGAIHWMRENLFSSVPSSILTLASIYFLYMFFSLVLPWLTGGVWTTTSLRECQELLQGEIGGCFSVLSERWNQLLFGFKYPSEFYWRPSLAFVMLFAAAAPVLFFALPRKLLVFTGLYPFIAFWLIWGGSLWVPAFVLAGLVVLGVVVNALIGRSFFIAMMAGLGFVLVYFVNVLGLGLSLIEWLVAKLAGQGSEILVTLANLKFASSSLFAAISGLFSGVAPLALEAVASRDMGGFMLNIMLGTICVSLSLPFGILLALGRQSNMPFIKMICVVFIEFIRGVPLITLLFVANVVLAYFLPPGTTFDLILRVIIMITMFSSAYIAEVIRGGLAALPKGQKEAADSLGLDYPQAMRLIILPQALKISIPGIVNVAVGLFKDTTLVSVISMFDVVGFIRGPLLGSKEWNGVYWEVFGFAAVLFFIICYSISQYSQWLERQLSTEHR